MAAAKIDYNALEFERSGELQQELYEQLEKKVLINAGMGENLVRAVLKSVVGGDYERAREEIKVFVDARSDLPTFAPRVARYVQHSRDLINAIRAKRHFPGLATLSMSKQQELLDNVVGHFEELKQFLKKIDQVYHDLRVEDMRSTVLVVKSFFYTLIFVLCMAFIFEAWDGMAHSFNLVLDQAVDDILDIVFSIF